MTMMMQYYDRIISLIPLAVPCWYLIPLILDDKPLHILQRWMNMLLKRLLVTSSSSTSSSTSSTITTSSDVSSSSSSSNSSSTVPPVGSQLLAYVSVALFGYVATSKLVPHIKVKYSLQTKRTRNTNIYICIYWAGENHDNFFFLC